MPTATKPEPTSDAYTYLVPAAEDERTATPSQIAYANLLLALHRGEKICNRWIKPDGNQVAALSTKRCHQLINQLKRDPATRKVALTPVQRQAKLRERIRELEFLLAEIEWRRDEDPEHDPDYERLAAKTEDELDELNQQLAQSEAAHPADRATSGSSWSRVSRLLGSQKR
jgi:hypothetical protein